MPRCIRRHLAIVLLPLFVLQASGCTHIVRQPAGGPAPTEKDELVGVTTLAGQEFRFDGVGAIRNDTLLATVQGDQLILPADSVQRWWVRQANTGATIGLVAGAVMAVVLIAAATAPEPEPQEVESCPFIYSWNGTEYVFNAEPYGGALTLGLQRDDYNVLPDLVSEGGRFRLRMINQLDETQMTNLMELWAVAHDPGLQILPDAWGGLHTVGNPVPPTSAITQAGLDLTPWLASDDWLIWEPPPVADSTGDLQDALVLTFPRPPGAASAKLVSRVGTSVWGSHMVRQMLELRGTGVGAWYDLVDTSPAAADSVRAWAIDEALYGTAVEVEGESGWDIVGVMGGGGPYLAQARVIPFELPPTGADSLRIRIRMTRGFWALNYLAVDFSSDQPIEVDTLHVRAGVASSGADVVALVAAADTLHYPMPVTGEWADLEFPDPGARPGMARTILLHSRGYYHLHLDPTAAADTAMLHRIETVPGAAARYSAELYLQRMLAARSSN